MIGPQDRVIGSSGEVRALAYSAFRVSTTTSDFMESAKDCDWSQCYAEGGAQQALTPPDDPITRSLRPDSFLFVPNSFFTTPESLNIMPLACILQHAVCSVFRNLETLTRQS
jgi:hypothetical protein